MEKGGTTRGDVLVDLTAESPATDWQQTWGVWWVKSFDRSIDRECTSSRGEERRVLAPLASPSRLEQRPQSPQQRRSQTAPQEATSSSRAIGEASPKPIVLSFLPSRAADFGGGPGHAARCDWNRSNLKYLGGRDPCAAAWPPCRARLAKRLEPQNRRRGGSALLGCMGGGGHRTNWGVTQENPHPSTHANILTTLQPTSHTADRQAGWRHRRGRCCWTGSGPRARTCAPPT